MRVVAYPAVIREASDRVRSFVEEEIQLAQQVHGEHDAKWHVSRGWHTVLRLVCETCRSDWSWTFAVTSRNLDAGPAKRPRGYRPSRGER